MKYLMCLFLFICIIAKAADPIITIPKIIDPPKIDGKLSPGEWKNAAAVTMFGYFNHSQRALSLQQPVFYYAWDDSYLYIAMDCLDSSTNSICAEVTRNDVLSLIGDDCVELMFADGTGKEIYDMDFPTYYIALNPIGTIWDAKFKNQRNECHNSWQSGAEFESTTNGTRWCFELRVPIKNISAKVITPGTKWRTNFCRTFYRYKWVALNPDGALNDARIGADLIFGDIGSAVQLKSVDKLINANFSAGMELVNSSKKDKTFDIAFNAQSQESAAEQSRKSAFHKVYKVPAGKSLSIDIGNGEKLSFINQVELTVKDEDNRIILQLPRNVIIPCPGVGKTVAKENSPVSVETLFLPSKETLSIHFSAKYWLKKVSLPGGNFSADIRILTQKKEIVRNACIKFSSEEKWSVSTLELPEGSYSVECDIFSNGKKLMDFSDWFEKKIFDWMKKPTIDRSKVPHPYSEIKIANNTVDIWGRSYQFGENGLPVSMKTQGKEYLTGPVRISLNKKTCSPLEKFHFTKKQAVAAEGQSVLAADNVRVRIESVTEYDGFILFKTVCIPEKKGAKIDNLRVTIPLNNQYIKFHSGAGDKDGVCFMGKPVPENQGRIFDSLTDTRCVVTTPSFASLYWVADHEVSFCYAADSDYNWSIRKDIPAIQAYRKGTTVELTIDLVNRPVILNEPRTMEFALQTGPTKPLPENWRAFEDCTDGFAPDMPENVPAVRYQIGGDGFTTHGGSHSIHPGTNDIQKSRSTMRIAEISKKMNGRAHVVGYQYWGHTVKGFPEVRVFRSEWGISRHSYDNPMNFDASKWSNRIYGDDRANYNYIPVKTCPSYVNFLIWAYDAVLKNTSLYGFYDDVGYPFPNFYPEFGQGWVDEFGDEHYSTGLWLYRDRWKQASMVNAQNKRLNLLSDSQHIHAHFMPAYGFIGAFTPCEQGFYNPFPEKDAYDFYGSMEHYAAMCPAKQTGQFAFIGLGSYRPGFAGFSSDSRSMFMLTAMNDHSLGSFGRREWLTIYNLIQARAIFRRWEKNTEFTGYWAESNKVSSSCPDLKVSYYTRNGSALFLLANVGNKDLTFKVTPDLKAMGIDRAKVKFIHAENLKTLPFDGTFSVEIAKHDICMILCGPDGTFQLPEVVPWDSFLEKGNVMEFKGIFPVQGVQELGKFNGKWYLQGVKGGFAQAESIQPLPREFMVSALVGNNSFLGIRWKNGSSLSIAPMSLSGKDFAEISVNDKFSSIQCALNKKYQHGFYSKVFNAVKIRMLQDKVEFYLSSDAKTWQLLQTVMRPVKCAEAPEALVIGWGQTGSKTLQRNLAKSFDPLDTRMFLNFFSNVNLITEK